MHIVVREPLDILRNSDTLGQSWQDEAIAENIKLCKFQTIEPFMRKWLPARGSVLEAGCGLGRWVFYLRNLGYDICGVDASATAVSTAKKYDPKAPIMRGDIRNLEFAQGSFDAVISLGVVEHFEGGPQQVLLEARRVLKDDGVLLISVPTLTLVRALLWTPMHFISYFLKRIRGVRYAFSQYLFTRREFVRHLGASGFDVVCEGPDDFLHPYNIGLYVDLFFLRGGRKWELNRIGKCIDKALRPWCFRFYMGGLFFICKKEPAFPFSPGSRN